MMAAGQWLRLLRRIAYLSLTLSIVAAGCFTLWYRSYYNIWPGQDATARVHWCERDYQNAGPPAETWAQVSAGWRWPVRDVGQYPPLGLPGQELVAAIYPGSQPSSCATVVYVRIGQDSYQPYGLLGGP
jgi:hypothetical protein